MNVSAGSHPTEEILTQWLNGGEPAWVSKHLLECAQCLEHLDEMTTLDHATELVLRLGSEPPAELVLEAEKHFHKKVAQQEALATVVDLFALLGDVISVMAEDTKYRRSRYG